MSNYQSEDAMERVKEMTPERHAIIVANKQLLLTIANASDSDVCRGDNQRNEQ